MKDETNLELQNYYEDISYMGTRDNYYFVGKQETLKEPIRLFTGEKLHNTISEQTIKKELINQQLQQAINKDLEKMLQKHYEVLF